MSEVKMSRDEIRGELQRILQRITATEIQILDTTEVYKGLEIAGDDAWEMLDEIRQKFGSDFNGFDFDAYFPNDLDAFFSHLGRLFGFRDNSKKILTVGHVVDVIQKGTWFEPPHSK